MMPGCTRAQVSAYRVKTLYITPNTSEAAKDWCMCMQLLDPGGKSSRSQRDMRNRLPSRPINCCSRLKVRQHKDQRNI